MARSDARQTLYTEGSGYLLRRRGGSPVERETVLP